MQNKVMPNMGIYLNNVSKRLAYANEGGDGASFNETNNEMGKLILGRAITLYRQRDNDKVKPNTEKKACAKVCNDLLDEFSAKTGIKRESDNLVDNTATTLFHVMCGFNDPAKEHNEVLRDCVISLYEMRSGHKVRPGDELTQAIEVACDLFKQRGNNVKSVKSKDFTQIIVHLMNDHIKHFVDGPTVLIPKTKSEIAGFGKQREQNTKEMFVRTVESQEKAYLKILDKLKKDRQEKFDQHRANEESPSPDDQRPTDAMLEKLAAEEELKQTVQPGEVIKVTVES